MMRTISLILMLTLLLAACAGRQAPPTPRVEDIQTAIAQTEAARPTATNTFVPPTQTNTPEPTRTLAPTATATPSGPVTGTVFVAALNLRAGPSTFFEVLESFPEGTQLLATGRDESGEWVQVEIPGEQEDEEKTLGWFASVFIQFQGDPNFLPVVAFPLDQQVRATVQDTEGNPIPGVVVAFIYRDGTDELRNNSISTDQGVAVTYLPPDLLGTLDVQIVGHECTSPVMDVDCEMRGYFQLAWRSFVLIPQRAPLLLQYEVATTEISGTVVDGNGKPVVGIQVQAVRDDGALSYGVTGAEGAFNIPAGPGLWEVYSVTFNPRLESDVVTVEITDATPEPVEVPAP
ncbi:MAG: SH3 domain-containing protein [Chloroflexi bacterium]|nr:SH3 domain-containing protein [Chloroflexota bacterium]